MSERARRGLHLYLSGRVQGVGFRHFARREAGKLGLVGWVKNLPDGRVEIQVAGDRERLEEYKQRLDGGPSFARVDHIEEHELDHVPDWDGFDVRF